MFSTPQARGEVGFWWSPGPLNAADTPFPWSDLAGAGLPLDLGLKSLLKEAIALPILPIPSRWGWAPSAAPTPFHSHPAAAAAKLLSRVRRCVTPWTAAHQAPPSMGFSRQEDWSGVPLPSPVLSLSYMVFRGRGEGKASGRLSCSNLMSTLSRVQRVWDWPIPGGGTLGHTDSH